MEINDILTIIHEVSESKLTSFKYEEDGTVISIKADRMPKVTAAGQELSSFSCFPPMPPAVQAPETGAPAVQLEKEEKIITSPMVGTFYTAASEDAEPFVSVGDTVKKGQVVGIVEAMKLMNEIESPFDGIVEEVLAENKEMIGFGQILFRIR